MDTTYDTKYQSNITCPYCGYVNYDSWEYDDNDGETCCGSCGKKFLYERHVSVEYSTSVYPCKKHKFDNGEYRIKKRNFIRKPGAYSSEWVDLPEEQWEYYKKMNCTKCEEVKFVDIDREEYLESTK